MSSLTLTLTESNVSVANNTSDVSVAVTVKFTDGWWAAHEVGSSMSVTCNGTSKTLSFGPYNIGANGSKNLGSVKFTGIKHNSDGSKSVSASATWVVPFGNGYKVSGSASKALTKIARASSIGTISGSTFGSAVTVNISRLNSGFTHTVTYKFGSITRSYTGQATSCVFTPPLSDASQIPGAVSGTGSVSVQTYSGSTAIGSAVSKSFTLNLPASAVPSMSGPTISKVDNGVPSAWGIYVKGFSKANVSISGAGIYGSSISSYALSGGGYSSSSNTLSTGVLNTPGSNTFTGTVRDSRGRTATASQTITVIDYTNPNVSLSVERCNSNGVANTDGVYVKVIASFTYASVSGKNSIASKKITVGSYTNTTFTSGNAVILGGALSTDKSYIAEVTISDALGRTATTQTVVPTGAVTIDLKAGGKGVAFGKVAEIDNLVDCAWKVKVPQIELIKNGVTSSISSENSSATHYKTSAPCHYFDKDVKITGNIYGGPNYNKRCIFDGDSFHSNNTIIADNGFQTSLNSAYKAGSTIYGTQNIELYGNPPFIDFHAKNSATDYTSRVIDWGTSFELTTNTKLTLSHGKASLNWWYDQENYGGYFTPSREDVTLGRMASLWHRVYARYSEYTPSDIRLKENIKDYDERFEKMFMDLRPVTFEMKDDPGKRQCGMIAQWVKSSMDKFGIEEKEFAVYEHSEEEDMYGLIYPQMTSLNTHMIQKTIKQVSTIKNEISDGVQQLENKYQQEMQKIQKDFENKLTLLDNRIRRLESK